MGWKVEEGGPPIPSPTTNLKQRWSALKSLQDHHRQPPHGTDEKTQPREVEALAQGHRVNEWQGCD